MIVLGEGYVTGSRFKPAVVAVFAALAVLAGCPSSDPLRDRIEHRARYDVTLQSWAEKPDGTIVASVRVSGPVNRELDRLTVELVRSREDGSRIGSDWVTLDLSRMQRGAPFDTTVVLPPGEESAAGLGVDLHRQPTKDDIAHIPELQGLK